MGKSHSDQRRHRRKVAGTPKGLTEHRKRDKRRGKDRPHGDKYGYLKDNG